MEDKELIYIGDAYFSRVGITLLGLNHLGEKGDTFENIDNDANCNRNNGEDFELISFKAFNQSLYELLYASVITGIEDYLRCRLRKEVFLSDITMRRYAEKYNEIHEKQRFKLNIKSKTDVLRKNINESLSRQIYHQCGYIKDYLEAITETSFQEVVDWGEIEDIVDMRNGIIHGDKITRKGRVVSVTPYDVNRTYDFALNFRDRLEDFFESIGHGKIYDIPDME